MGSSERKEATYSGSLQKRVRAKEVSKGKAELRAKAAIALAGSYEAITGAKRKDGTY